jgi:hypothetical protein
MVALAIIRLRQRYFAIEEEKGAGAEVAEMGAGITSLGVG